MIIITNLNTDQPKYSQSLIQTKLNEDQDYFIVIFSFQLNCGVCDISNIALHLLSLLY